MHAFLWGEYVNFHSDNEQWRKEYKHSFIGLAKDQPFHKIFLTLSFYDIYIISYLYNMTTYL